MAQCAVWSAWGAERTANAGAGDEAQRQGRAQLSESGTAVKYGRRTRAGHVPPFSKIFSPKRPEFAGVSEIRPHFLVHIRIKCCRVKHCCRFTVQFN